MKKALLCIIITAMLLSCCFMFAPHVSAQTNDVKILSYTYYVDSLGILVVVGEIQNTGSNILSNIIITGTAFDPDGAALRDSYAPIYGNNILPQEKAPFLLQFANPQNSIDGTWNFVSIGKIELAVGQASVTNVYQYPDLKIIELSSYIDSTSSQRGAYWATGKVENIGSQNAQNIVVYGIFYNKDGDVIGVGYTDTLTPYTLSPGDTASFNVAPWDLNVSQASADKQVASYKMLVQVEGPTRDDGNVPTLTPGPTPGNSPTPLSSQNSNDTSSGINEWLLYIAVIIIVVIAIVAAYITFPRRKAPVNKKAKGKNLHSKSPSKKLQRQVSLPLLVMF
jgi:hypothetical protein